MALIIAPEEELVYVLEVMAEKAKELNVEGTSAAISSALVLDLAQRLGNVSDEELAGFAELTLAELISEMHEGSLVGGIIPILNAIHGRAWREPDPERDKPDELDAGTNYIGYVEGKAAQVLRTGVDSQAEGSRKGESPSRGAIIRDKIALAFSGGREQQDLDIAEAGYEAYEYLQDLKQQEAKKQKLLVRGGIYKHNGIHYEVIDVVWDATGYSRRGKLVRKVSYLQLNDGRLSAGQLYTRDVDEFLGSVLVDGQAEELFEFVAMNRLEYERFRDQQDS